MFWKVVDYSTEEPTDQLKEVCFLYEAVPDACQRLYQAEQDVLIDKRIVRSKACFIFRQDPPKKPVRWDTKLFAACDSSRYCFGYSIYTGQEIDGHTEADLIRVVQDLSVRLHHQGYIIYTDNFYTSGNLAEALTTFNLLAQSS